MKRVFVLLIVLTIPGLLIGYLLQPSGGMPDADNSNVQSPPSAPPAGTTGRTVPKTQPDDAGEENPNPQNDAANPDGTMNDVIEPENPDDIPEIPMDVNPDDTTPPDATGTDLPPDTKGTTTTTTGTGTTTGTTTSTGTTTTGTTTGGTRTGTAINTTTTPKNSDMLDFDFRNSPLDQVVKYFASQVNKNFIIPKTLSTSTVTIITGRPIPKERAFEVLKTILATEQWSLYEDENFIRIEKQGTPQDKIIPTDVILIKGEGIQLNKSDTTTTAIVVLNYISAQEIQNILAPMRSPSSIMTAFTRINALFIRDTERNIDYILSIIQKLDQPGTSGKITMVKLQYSVAAEIAQTLSLVLQANAIEAMDMGLPPQPGGAPRQPGARGAQGAINIIPDKRTNTLIIIATERETEALMNLIAELDSPTNIQEVSIHTYQCNNQKAADLAKILGDFVDKRPTLQQIAGQPPIPQSVTGMPQIDYFFIADPVTNTLVIQAPPQDWPLYREILKNLDQPQRQALIEVWIVEVSSTDDQTIGVDIIPSDVPPNERTGPLQNEIYGASISGGTGSGIFGGTTTTDGEDGGSGSSAGTGATIGIRALTATEISIDGRKIRIPNFDTFIRAVKSKSNVKILASPKLMTLNNKEATVNISDQIGISTGTVTNLETTGGVLTESITRTDVGIQLSLTPQINADDFVIMELNLVVSNVVGELTTNPTIAKRETKSSVRCENKQTIVISGLRRQNKTKSKKGVPLLGDIPLVGRLFSTTTQNNINTNLLIFITPHIVTETSDMTAMTDIMKSQRLENEEPRFIITGKGGKTSKSNAPKVIWNR